jgi:hypothetical protein
MSNVEHRQEVLRAVCKNIANTLADLMEHGGWEVDVPQEEACSLFLQQVGPTSLMLTVAGESSSHQIKVHFELA